MFKKMLLLELNMFLNSLMKYAERGVNTLNPQGASMLKSFLLSLERDNGGFAGVTAAGASDIYYTPFAVMALSALGVAPKPTKLAGFADSVSEFEPLDLAHLASLARLEALIRIFECEDAGEENLFSERRQRRDKLISEISEYRASDGGFSHFAKLADNSTPYGVFLAANALLELGASELDPAILAESVMRCRLDDGSFSNSLGGDAGGANSTAAAVAILSEFGGLRGISMDSTIDYIRSMRCAAGGFKANALVPLPDVMSTATALISLDIIGVELDAEERSDHLEFIQDHWRDVSDISGGFAGDIIAEVPDAEYTFYAIMSLGLLKSIV